MAKLPISTNSGSTDSEYESPASMMVLAIAASAGVVPSSIAMPVNPTSDMANTSGTRRNTSASTTANATSALSTR